MFMDTSFCVDLFREQNNQAKGPATRKLEHLGDTPIMASVFVVCELQAGARMSQNPDAELRKVEIFTDRIGVIYPDSVFAVAYGEAEAFLRSMGKPVPTMDLLIGIQAKIHGLPLLTRDATHFKLIPGLVIESY